MNENSANKCKCPRTVISKYFSSSPVMDESLSDFKEKKKGNTGPKNSSKVASKAKKAPKRIRGQKDIRTALKTKKNELLTYSKEFDEVCKQSGVDVDPEQLQLAIALSKSVESGHESTSSLSTQLLSAKERTGRIRTTLQQYGFNVPEIKITSNKRQKKKYRENYKLLLASNDEKQQIISDRYSQIVFENICGCNKIDYECSLTNKKFYYLSTSISYMELKNNDFLYVDNLIEKSSNNGVLLRDWADIPGRPQSPKSAESIKMNFSEIECSQDELDVVLSGTLRSAKSIVHNKPKVTTENAPVIIIDDGINNEVTEQVSNKSQNECAENDVENEIHVKNDLLNSRNNMPPIADKVRSKSPDIFDDEESGVWDNSNTTSENCRSLTKQNNDIIMDLTGDNFNDGNDYNDMAKHLNDDQVGNTDDIVNVLEVSNCHLENKGIYCNNEIGENNESIMNISETNNDSQNLYKEYTTLYSPKVTFSQTNNFTRRHTNDFMEITECVAVISDGNPDSTLQSKNKTRRISNDLMEITECVDKYKLPSVKIEDNIDLTQSFNENNELVNAIVETVVDKVVDLSQSSNSEDELPFVQISGSQASKLSLDDTILLNSDEIIVDHKPATSPVNDQVILVEHKQGSDGGNISTLDLTHTPPSPKGIRKMASQSFFDEFVHNHSDNTSKDTLNISSHSENNLTTTNDEKVDLTNSNAAVHDDIEVDLTQSSNNSSNKSMEELGDKSIYTPVRSDLGKKNEVSIDYDDLFDDIASKTPNDKSDNSRTSSTFDVNVNNVNTTGNESRNSQTFNISDKELEYSLNRSRNDFNVHFGGISVMDDISGVDRKKSESNIDRHSNNSNINTSKSMSDSYLPMVSVKGCCPNVKTNTVDEGKILEEVNVLDKPAREIAADTPYRASVKENAITSVTPKSSDYIIKTDQVTPMLDYASMSTPERNKELDRYGLKPFKRKRAIQLLTHLYNQTHPVVESCQDDLPSPSKKRKHSSQLSPIKPKSPKKLKSPRKLLNSPRKLVKSPNPKHCSQNEKYPEFSEDGNMFEVTNASPEIRDIQCSEEDWVFQKREKAKLHSCRVPLHIALHNYVSCRRRLREAILKYEPVNIDVIHKELAASGYRCDPKELLKYMDKKCITVKTADNNARNSR